jgi:multiple sugar transport system substrate-binding protein
MKRFVAGAAAASALLVLTACGSSSGSKSAGSSGGTSSAASSAAAAGGSVTLKLVAADYGSGPADASSAYWKSVIDDFEKANPNIKVDATIIN